MLDIYPQNVTFKEAFTKLDTTRMSTKILYDMVIPKDSFVKFTGINDSACAVADRWKYMYAWLQFAHLKACNMPDLQTISGIISADIAQNKIPFGLINLKCNLIKTNAFADNLLSYHDDYFWDGSNQSETPYTEGRSFIASTLTENVKSLSPSFFLDESLFFTETDEQIQTLSIDFDDGNGYVTLYPDDEYAVEYSSYGEKIIKIEAHSNNNVYFCKTTINIEPTPPSYVPSNSIIPVSATYQDTTYYGSYKIWYGCNNNGTLKKPLIFVEGFDPLNVNRLDDSTLYNIANQDSLIEKLNSKGYDVIMLDFASGGAKIQANAMVLRELINIINQQKTEPNELVIVGASMGGLVARYALAYMEHNNENHQTRLYVSFDTPHQGAYFPLSSQYLIKQLDEIHFYLWLLGIPLWYDIQVQRYKIDCDAAKQMLVYHYSATDNNKAYPHQLRLDFQNELNSLTTTGYPQQCRKIAISEGSGNGTIQDGHEIEKPYIDINTLVNQYKITLKMDPLPNNELDTILKLNINIIYKNSITKFSSLDNINIVVDNTKPYDSAPGGNYSIIKPLIDGLNSALGLGLNYEGKECFVPTMSALDINSSNILTYDIRSNITNHNDAAEIIDHNITTFDAIYAEGKNNQHINDGITEKMATWLISQIDKNFVYIQNAQYSAKVIQYEANQSLFAGSNVTSGTQGDVIIKDNSNVTFAAGESVVLSSGFSVKAGSSFHAYIKDYSCQVASQMNMMVKSSLHKNSNITINESNNKLTNNPSPPIAELKQDRIKVTPNPTDGEFNISIDQPDCQNVTIQLFNIMGSLVYSDIADVGLVKRIYINKQPKGIYLLKIINTNGQIMTKKIIKK